MASSPLEREDDAVREVTRSWQLGLFVGFVTLILGIVIAVYPTSSINVICVLIGIVVLVGGVFRIIRSFDAAEQHRAWLAILGILMIVIGVALIRHLHFSRLLVALLIGIIFIVQGVVDLMIGFSGEAREGRAWPIVIGFLSLALGIIIIAVPENSLTVLAVLVGIWFAVLGLLEIIGSFILRHELKRSTAGP